MAKKNQHFFATNDNKDCVAVKGTAGFSNLWQHHLIKLPMVTLEIAEAIIAVYPTPRLLLKVSMTEIFTTYATFILTLVSFRRTKRQQMDQSF